MKKGKTKHGGKMQASLEPKATTAIANPIATAGITPHIRAEDLVIPKILPIHYMSDKAMAKPRQAEPGEFRDTVENKLFGSVDKPFQFVPISMTTFWAVYDMTGGGQGKFVEQFPCTPANEGLAREEQVGGKPYKRVMNYECFCLLPDEIKSGTAFPYVLSFRVTSSRAGKTLLTQLYVRNKMAKKEPYGTVCEVSLTEEENDQGQYFVQHVKPIRAATADEQTVAHKWFETINAGKIKKDDSDIVGGVESADSVNTDKF